MKVRKYTARSSRDALRQVREDLGPDAVILANRMVKGGVEVMAMAAAEMAAHQAATSASRPPERVSQPLEVSEDDVVAFPAYASARREAAQRPWAGLGLEASERRRDADPASLPASRWDPLFERRQGGDQASLQESRWDPLFESGPAPAPPAPFAPAAPGADEPALRSEPGVFRKLDLAFDPQRLSANPSPAPRARPESVVAREQAPLPRREPMFREPAPLPAPVPADR